MVHAPADLLIGRKEDTDSTVLHLRVLGKKVDGVHNFGHAGFVICPQQRRPASCDDIVPDFML